VVASEDGRLRERELLARARRGEMEAFEELYRLTVGRVYGLCMRLSGRAAEAEELTQDVFVRAWSKLSTFRGDSAFFSWLYPLTLSVFFTERRARTRRESKVMATDDLTPFEDASPRPLPHAALDLERALATLPPGARQVFVLHDVEGYRHEEIGRLMGIAAGTSKAQLHRARRLLREALGQ